MGNKHEFFRIIDNVCVDTGIARGQEFGCPSGWLTYNTSCYLFSSVHGMHYVEAEHYCIHHHDGHLVTIESAKENQFLRDYVSRLKGEDYWIGLTDELIEGDWKWESTGNTAVYTDWYPGQPSNSGGDEDCASLLTGINYHWNDAPCNFNYRPLCEKSEVIPVEVIG